MVRQKLEKSQVGKAQLIHTRPLLTLFSSKGSLQGLCLQELGLILFFYQDGIATQRSFLLIFCLKLSLVKFIVQGYKTQV